MSSISSDLYEEILKPNKSHTNRIIQTVPCKTALSNTRNKQNIINLFSGIQVKEVFKTIHAPGDEESLIALTALSYSKEKQVKVIGEDTDILVLICHYVNKEAHKLCFNLKVERGTFNI